jgi:hypothetical protein
MSMTDDDLTRAARTMIAVEPPQDLEARIKRRLDLEPQRRPAITRWPLVAAMAGAVATVVIAFALRSPEVPESRGLPAVAVAKAGPEVPKSPGLPAVALPLGDSSGQREPGRTLAKAGPAIATPIRLPSYRSMSQAEWDWMSRRVPALDVIDPIQPEAVSITPLTVTPLTSSPISGDPDEGRQ